MALPDPERSRVVLIGTSQFTDPELPDLPAVRNNIAGLAACFTNPALWGVPEVHCRVVPDPDSAVALIDPIHEAATEAEDTLLIYYAGHGLVHGRTLDLLLAVVGSNPGRGYTAVPYDEVRHNVIDSPARRKIVILDCCYSGRAIGGQADHASALATETAIEGAYLLTSAPPNKQSLSPPGETYTAFTGALLQILTQGVQNEPEYLQLGTIYRSVRHALKRTARPEPQLRVDNNVNELALVRNASFRAQNHEPGHLPDQFPDTQVPPDLLRLLLTDQASKQVLDQLFHDRVIVLNTEIDDEAANRVTAQMLILAEKDPKADIGLYINSTGGSVTAGMAIYDTIKLIEPDVSTWAIGLASGMAQLVLSAGAPGKRYALPHARILLKSIFSTGPTTKEHTNVLAKWTKEITTVIAEATNQPVKQVRADSNQARWFSAREARDYRLVDHVVAGLHVA
jgi:ATP-dependent Clp endopeptidase proteolytic subunit ClpP